MTLIGPTVSLRTCAPWSASRSPALAFTANSMLARTSPAGSAVSTISTPSTYTPERGQLRGWVSLTRSPAQRRPYTASM